MQISQCKFNLRYQPVSHLISRLNHLHQQHRMISKRMDRMISKIEEKTEVAGVTLDQDTHDDMLNLMNSKSDYFDNLPEDSFRQLFWSQQLKAASQKNARCMNRPTTINGWDIATSRSCPSYPRKKNLKQQQLEEHQGRKLKHHWKLKDHWKSKHQHYR